MKQKSDSLVPKIFHNRISLSITMHQIFERRRHLRLTLNQKMVTKPREVFIFLGDQESRGINNSKAYFEVFSDFECWRSKISVQTSVQFIFFIFNISFNFTSWCCLRKLRYNNNQSVLTFRRLLKELFASSTTRTVLEHIALNLK